ncbi:hypothetical protein KQX54_012338 [Cotesia glomerata]|uniref:Uncharacterized protein n=1 Tax=Cotesia glomerata TaxID=32391 RepID=A0AAV7IJE8_COTGL|nr:hypothetical protein KQX54_012338 [Cotesia glomerata]
MENRLIFYKVPVQEDEVDSDAETEVNEDLPGLVDDVSDDPGYSSDTPSEIGGEELARIWFGLHSRIDEANLGSRGSRIRSLYVDEELCLARFRHAASLPAGRHLFDLDLVYGSPAGFAGDWYTWVQILANLIQELQVVYLACWSGLSGCWSPMMTSSRKVGSKGSISGRFASVRIQFGSKGSKFGSVRVRFGSDSSSIQFGFVLGRKVRNSGRFGFDSVRIRVRFSSGSFWVERFEIQVGSGSIRQAVRK